MASSNLYQAEQYTHKKFAKHTNKRKQKELEGKENVNSAQTILDMANKETEQPLAKRQQTKAFFRPWLDKEDKKKNTKQTPKAKVLNPVQANQQPSQLPQQTRHNRKHLATLIHQYNQQAQQYLLQQQQYYAFYQQQQVAAKLSHVLYLQQLQQMALKQQQQSPIFVFGQQ
ncbi:putative cyclin-dependent serine/threonine-protein kinase DDB_G0272797/DDB_G0274007 [Lucilia sericata]|uniref:putative cyclin-dependent serine/threonine-protein kinase DDB_G0272797/DDB_G0274007 n=1 Tax=Lucilia sericata TaxID=13632 RepID=UPI0018A8251F|nr:putative cyclin-dependent serine/threonine-protein kinase DDB_G0272797/DDB_G0274007 [Lucilia sericata]